MKATGRCGPVLAAMQHVHRHGSPTDVAGALAIGEDVILRTKSKVAADVHNATRPARAKKRSNKVQVTQSTKDYAIVTAAFSGGKQTRLGEGSSNLPGENSVRRQRKQRTGASSDAPDFSFDASKNADRMVQLVVPVMKKLGMKTAFYEVSMDETGMQTEMSVIRDGSFSMQVQQIMKP